MHSNVFAEISGSATMFRAPSSIARAGALDPVSIGRVTFSPMRRTTGATLTSASSHDYASVPEPSALP